MMHADLIIKKHFKFLQGGIKIVIMGLGQIPPSFATNPGFRSGIQKSTRYGSIRIFRGSKNDFKKNIAPETL